MQKASSAWYLCNYNLSDHVRGLRRLLLVVVGRGATLIWWKVLAVKFDRCGRRVVPCVLLIRWRGTKVLRLTVRCRVDCWIVCRRILPALCSLLRSRVSNRGVDEETNEASTV